MADTYHPDKGPSLRELEPGDQFVGFYTLRNKQLEPFRDASRGYFLTLILSDSSGQLLARVWEGAEQAYEELKSGEVVKLQGEVETYLDRLQARVQQVRPAKPGEYDRRDMLPSSPRARDEMLAELGIFIEQVEQPDLRALVDFFFDDQDFLNNFAQAPAARRVHHAYLGGLIEHTLELLKIAATVMEVYPQINADLLRTGVLFHDLGKVREFVWDLDIDYSDEGRLFGHIVMADEMVTAAIKELPEFPPQLAMPLRHMLLSHHGRYEWGSPRRPKTLEAVALHHIENLGAQLNRFHLLLQDVAPDKQWTSYDRLLKRQLYAGSDDDLNIEERSLRE
ncbi:MAG: HD domain-containing protein [Chloroflexi bacterium]|nr:HD domain-containing protein [Chloroflexota bacterium]